MGEAQAMKPALLVLSIVASLKSLSNILVGGAVNFFFFLENFNL